MPTKIISVEFEELLKHPADIAAALIESFHYSLKEGCSEEKLSDMLSDIAINSRKDWKINGSSINPLLKSLGYSY